MNALMTLLLAANASAAAPATPAAKTEAIDGKKIYIAKCATCHGKDGKGSPAMAKMFKVSTDALNLASEATAKKTDGELTKLIADGKGKMPAFKAKLKDAELSSLLAYIRSLKK